MPLPESLRFRACDSVSEVSSMERRTRPAPTRILLVSSPPPPMGGVQIWTVTLLRRGCRSRSQSTS